MANVVTPFANSSTTASSSSISDGSMWFCCTGCARLSFFDITWIDEKEAYYFDYYILGRVSAASVEPSHFPPHLLVRSAAGPAWLLKTKTNNDCCCCTRIYRRQSGGHSIRIDFYDWPMVGKYPFWLAARICAPDPHTGKRVGCFLIVTPDDSAITTALDRDRLASYNAEARQIFGRSTIRLSFSEPAPMVDSKAHGAGRGKSSWSTKAELYFSGLSTGHHSV
jgi:hypothetical protein